ncbi:radical SAM protein [Agrobacterium vitis]|uniref:Radical SAM protein n=1 Tax=Agrobacterium vitis TaxID=373 RepID=A0A1S2DZV6_AGRVI|nr:radical SAM protein [Agrobacterium vitis]MCF1501260.1 radical SAM protein [Allorhizobium sp. Av2]PZU18809.1 MAG: radical SAM protein [Shinella sp.]MCF1479712.1 radical SAM protein [Agrobacterium vitis]MCM2443029.1 radical SAM protein [Agrobacterium vitis]MUO96551.1 radical SAM protein [Agrobacterium vitis]
MARSNVVVFVSAGMSAPKKRDHSLARRQLYLNYGALSLATMLQLKGYETLLLHGEHDTPEVAMERLVARGALPSSFPLMVSIPSFYALDWAKAFCALAKKADRDCRIIVGGRWVVGPDVAWLRTKLPEADILVEGLGEPIVESLLSGNPDLRRLSAPTPGFTLNHLLVDGYERYQPSVEASRGCGMKCVFCEERDIPLEKLRDPDDLAASMALVQEQYRGAAIHPYLQSSMFAPSRQWSERLALAVERLGLRVEWRTETRVDAMTPETVAALAQAGLKVIDLGLETASPAQILAMGKSRDPDRYLRRASDLVEACREHGVRVKANVLLYAGETQRTLDETTTWLDHHVSAIAGVSVGPVIAYGPPKTADPLLSDWIARGARPVDPASAEATGITMMHLSKDFDAAEAEAASLSLSRRFMDTGSYFELKSFSYYPRDYARADFDRDVAAADPARLPFALEPA